MSNIIEFKSKRYAVHPRGSVRYQTELVANRLTDEELHQAFDIWREEHYSGPASKRSDFIVLGLSGDGAFLQERNQDGDDVCWIPWPDIHEMLVNI